MPKRILVDATHVEETRVVVLENGRVTEYDSETSVKKQLKGNIYLAKITRVEPSLQSAFVEYGGDKHGFLPFSEIHPDYYDIPVADKKALLESIRSGNSKDDESEEEDESVKDAKSTGSGNEGGNEESSESEVDVVAVEEEQEIKDEKKQDENLYRKYKIQEVIKRNKIVLVQVEKEERGNKGASLTTFISLAGRYCVLMPNSLRRGGVSRRIENRDDRKRLKSVLKNLNIPVEKGLIIRTAGAKRAEDELRGDYNYLAGLWNGIIEKTKQSNAPAFIHAEGDIIKRTMRDLYNEKIDEVLIEGKEAFETAKDFIKVVMSGHASRVKQYKNKVPVFTRYKVEEQIAALYNPEVPLDSGGALVINPTEALISIDVNSGRSTGQRSVEETAVSTNIEAAREVARQLRLRDLSGLIVIDFIDMLDLRNKKTVEKVLRDAFADDRARIQIGRISTFGLLEMSRQRMASSFLEVNTMVCPTCVGAGVVKATESNAVTVLRAVENDVSRSKCKAIGVYVTQDVALYILNNKREPLSKIENKYNVKVFLNVDDTAGANSFYIEKMKGYEDSVPEADTRPVNKQEKPKKISEPQEDNNVEPFPEKKSRRETKREEIQEKKEARIVGADNIFEGLWKKIVE
ncbi:MAG: Rne/Rng family ribonuclease [Rickettsiales bacterium]|nr:Rne/Rng family ribonuclease [Pseudomonadota bacterium]MDA0967033.1 Rne/Rng family ribonuclease [Pseudomonadota bacterium]MDG4542481.1 Rne/Rng family ribonuclease [Rickettsiales bacterium]MDG4544985.1 Rne/Rng family ribonuclease [Rickettsiales bacterium]MDG4547108.1 Rne/Rng family ribonuclease [Rickettsiales bacterium]